MTNNIVVFDLETQRDMASVGGPQFFEKLGVSIGVAYHVGEQHFYHFEESQMGELVAFLEQAELVVGFNIRHFDYRVLSAYTDVDLQALPTCDILADVTQLLGYRLKLDSLVSETLGLRKNGDGLLALKWWNEGRLDLIRDYCQQDVDVTRRLWEYGRKHGHIWYWDRRGDERRPLPVSW